MAERGGSLGASVCLKACLALRGWRIREEETENQKKDRKSFCEIQRHG